MGYKNSLKFSVYALSLVFMASVASVAQADESLLWRIQNTLDAEIVPSFEKKETFFSIQVRPVVKKEVEFEVDLEAEQRAQEEANRRALLASDVLAQIRSLLESENAFNPDITTSKVDAVISGEDKKMVLIMNEWLTVGDDLDVPVRAKDQLNALVQNLANLDPDLAAAIENEVQEKLQQSRELKLVIQEIGDGYINLTDDRGVLHVINFNLNTY